MNGMLSIYRHRLSARLQSTLAIFIKKKLGRGGNANWRGQNVWNSLETVCRHAISVTCFFAKLLMLSQPCGKFQPKVFLCILSPFFYAWIQVQAGLAVEFKVVGGLVAASRPESTSGGQDNYFALGTVAIESSVQYQQLKPPVRAALVGSCEVRGCLRLQH